MIDNFDLIKNHLEFNKPGDFFHILIARRAKDVGAKGNLQLMWSTLTQKNLKRLNKLIEHESIFGRYLQWKYMEG